MALVVGAGDFSDSEFGEVGGEVLDVEEGEVLALEMVDEGR